MSERKPTRLNMVLKEFNISLERAVDYLKGKGITIEQNPNTKVPGDVYDLLFDEFATDKNRKDVSIKVGEEKRKEKEALRLEREREEQRRLEEEAKKAEVIRARAVLSGPKQVGTIDLNPKKSEEKPKEEAPKKEEKAPEVPAAKQEVAPVKTEEPSKEEKKAAEEVTKATPAAKETPSSLEVIPGEEKIETKYHKLSGATFTGQKIDLKQFERPAKKKEEKKDDKKSGAVKPQGQNASGTQSNDPNKQRSKRKRIKPGTQPIQPGGVGAGKGKPDFKGKKAPIIKVEPTEEEVKKQIQETLEKLQGKGSKSKAAKYRREKREFHKQRAIDEQQLQSQEEKILKVDRKST